MAQITGQHSPLTPQQLGLLVESNLSGRPGLNVIQIVIRFEDEVIDPAALFAAWSDLAARHETLRLSMDPFGADGPCQTVAPSVCLQLGEDDWQAHAPADPTDDWFAPRLDEWLRADRQRGIKFEQAPAWRVRLIRLGPARAVLVWTFHHALLDGTSFRILTEDLLSLYDAHCFGHPPPIPQPALPFADHCHAVASQDLTQGLAHFTRLLEGFDRPNALDPVFGTEQSCPNAPRRMVVERLLPPDESEALRARAAALGATTATLCQTAWGIVLARCSGRDEAVFGLTRRGRHLRTGAARSIGCFINTLPYRLHLTPDKTLGQLVTEAREQTLALHPHEHVPLAEIARNCDLPPGSALFDTLVMFDRDSLAARRWPGPARRVTEVGEMATPVIIAFHDDPSLAIRLEHDPVRLSHAGAMRIADYLLGTLRSLTRTAAEASLSEIDMLGQNERDRLDAHARPERPTPARTGNIALIDRFEAMAAARPTAPAVAMMRPGTGSGAAITYAALDRAADALAGRLSAAGIGPGGLVALALPRGADHVIALLAVLKAEAAFMPFDAGLPPEALRGMIERAGAGAVIARPGLAAAIGPGRWALIHPDGSAAPTGGTTRLPRGPHDPGRTACVIHTSGSTGLPKAVAVAQSCLSHHAAAFTVAFALGPEDRVLQFTSLGFDISIEEILPTLLAGACLVLRDDETVRSIPAFVDGLAAERITVANLPTAFWHVLTDHLDEASGSLPPTLRLVVAGGEKVSAPTLARWRARVGGVQWMNGYGPTETTITATLYDPDRDPFDGEDVPIGRPAGHARTHILCPDGSPAPLGATGDLWIGGPAVTLGYPGRPDLTEAAFRPDPFSPDPAARLYRTGDLALWRADGVLCWRGRIDRQTKLRGHRIEPAAIEAALEGLPAIDRAVVALDGAEGADPRLLAWVRLAPGAAMPDRDGLEQALGATLASDMMPVLIPVETFPQTRNGKIDTSRLPRPALSSVPEQHAAPADDAAADHATSAATRTMAKIFAALLDRPDVGATESFFDLGGHSLLSIRLMSRIEQRFGLRLSLADLYDRPTPAGLAACITARRAAEALNCLVPIRTGGHLPPLFAVHILGPNAGFFRPLADRLGPDQPVLGLTMDLLDPNAPESLERLAEVYARNIMAHTPTGPVVLAGVSQGAWVAFELARQLHAAGREVRALFLLDATGPGRARRRAQGTKGARHYVRAALTNMPSVLRGRIGLFRQELGFRLEKRRLRRFGRGGRQVLSAVTSTTHQAALELRIEGHDMHPHDGPICVIRSTGADEASPEALEGFLGWSTVAGGRIDMIGTPGDHLGILAEPQVAQLAQRMIEYLAMTSADPSPPVTMQVPASDRPDLAPRSVAAPTRTCGGGRGSALRKPQRPG
ncbi:MAG: amino acid adenylation domain-containing protein [Rubellimicrobium sp.]|nr:amino acid adenylation domain-containing protein [Rubellimicrobium sp.]